MPNTQEDKKPDIPTLAAQSSQPTPLPGFLGKAEDYINNAPYGIKNFRQGLDNIGTGLQDYAHNNPNLTNLGKVFTGGVGTLAKAAPVGNDLRSTAAALAMPPEIGTEAREAGGLGRMGEGTQPQEPMKYEPTQGGSNSRFTTAPVGSERPPVSQPAEKLMSDNRSPIGTKERANINKYYDQRYGTLDKPLPITSPAKTGEPYSITNQPIDALSADNKAKVIAGLQAETGRNMTVPNRTPIPTLSQTPTSSFVPPAHQALRDSLNREIEHLHNVGNSAAAEKLSSILGNATPESILKSSAIGMRDPVQQAAVQRIQKAVHNAGGTERSMGTIEGTIQGKAGPSIAQMDADINSRLDAGQITHEQAYHQKAVVRRKLMK